VSDQEFAIQGRKTRGPNIPGLAVHPPTRPGEVSWPQSSKRAGKGYDQDKGPRRKKKVRDCKFIHVKHLGSLCLRSERPVKTAWILEQYETRLAMHTKINVFSNAFKERSHKDIIREVLENFWTRLPKVVVTTLENMVGLKGFVDQLRAADELLRTKDFDRKWQDALDKREEKKRDE